MNAVTEKFHIAATHPALPGHFPDRPVVPGVILLDRVVAVVERIRGLRVVGFPQVKFLQPLLPGQKAELSIVEAGKSIHFRIVYAGSTIASGSLEPAP
jgi:3-hydroxymyristoyl/3-hydroxydecanoyl-(acyl carrier protein) dehydratase